MRKIHLLTRLLIAINKSRDDIFDMVATAVTVILFLLLLYLIYSLVK